MDSDGSSRPLETLLNPPLPSFLRPPLRSALKSPLKPLSRLPVLSRPPVLTDPPSAAWARCLGTTIALLTLTLPWMAVMHSQLNTMPATALPTSSGLAVSQPQ